MSLLDKLRESKFSKKFVYPLALTFMIPFSGCSDKDKDSNPTDPGGTYIPGETTNSNGEINLDIGNNTFDITLKNTSGTPLRGISVKGKNFGDGIHGFLAEDFSYEYFSKAFYFDVNGTSILNEERTFNINQELNNIRGRDYEKRTPTNPNEPYPDFRNLDSIGTVTLDELHNFYVENDVIFRNISILDFIVRSTNSPELTFALEAAKFRQIFIENLNNYNDIVNSIANFFGSSFEKEAYYLDVYQNNLGVIAHKPSSKQYATLKGSASSQGRTVSNVFITTISGPSTNSTYSDNNGNYFLKFLREGTYSFEATHSGYNPDEFAMFIDFMGYTAPKCNTHSISLTQGSGSDLETKILQPGPSEGKDAFVSTSWGGSSTNFGNDDLLEVMFMNSNDISRSYIQFNLSSIPSHANIESALLSIHGNISTSGGGDKVVARRVKSSWNENTITWNNKPNFDSFIYDDVSLPYRNATTPVEFNLTSLVQEWIDGSYSNYGIILMFENESGTKYGNFCSSDTDTYDGQGLWTPKLTIEYRD